MMTEFLFRVNKQIDRILIYQNLLNHRGKANKSAF
jgi:hypothetical protein